MVNGPAIRGWLVAAFAAFAPLLHAVTAEAQEWLYTVRPADTLWDLSEAYLLDVSYWRRLQALNVVADPNRMPPGLRLRIPIAWLRAQPIPARVTVVQGSAFYQRPGQATTEPVVVGIELNAGDEIGTGLDGNVTLEFGDGSELVLRAGGRMVFDTLSIYGGGAFIDSRLRLYQGRSEVRARSAEPGQSRYEIWTPAAISAVRGTDFRIGLLDGQATMRTEVLRGRVDITAKARTIAVQDGFGTIVDKGAAPRPPRALLPPPSLVGLPDVFERVPIRFRIADLPGAAAYRLEIARDASFESLVFDQVTASTTMGGIDLPDGEYHLRVRGVDDLGIEGFNAGRRVAVNARPEPPLLIEPDKDAVVPDGNPVFRWTRPDEAAAFRFQLAREGAFDRPLFEEAETGRSSVSLAAPLAPGLYGWRVATIARGGDAGPFSDIQGLRVPEPGPAVEPPETGDDAIMLRWNAGEQGDTYRLQMARDRAFEDVVVDTITTEPSATVTPPAAGEYFVRVITIPASGDEGAFGPVQSITYEKTPYWMAILPVFAVIVALLML
jgi:hypothetical protein